ncbi:MAG TPA: peptide chain release factor N(5)-glutamine methyltransferase [Aeromicrobium sp.]|nr:peptide chain release factor N(5)-glutamine methyltransferase [Aeromicrobium sp.]
MSAGEVIAAATAALEAGGVPSPRVDAETLYSHVTGKSRSMLAMSGPPHPEQLTAFWSMVAARVRRVPLQHLIGSASFRFVDVEVGPGVFIPRPETELLAGWAIDEAKSAIKESAEAPVVVDLCTGSGVIALSIVHECPPAGVHAVELDEGAFEWAARNLVGTGIDLRLGDAAEAFHDLDGTADVVVSNPPYIPLEAWESVAPEVRDHDPALALWSGEDGLDAIRMIEQAAWRLLKPGGVVGVEHADAQGESAPAVFGGRWSEVRDHADLAGRARYLTARKP